MQKFIHYIKQNWKDLLSNLIIISYGVCIFICTGLMIMYFVGLSHDNEWLSFWGAIIGGLLTIVGVAWTLNEQNEQFKKNLAVQKQLANEELTESIRQFQLELQQKDVELELIKQHRTEELSFQYRPILSVSINPKRIDDTDGIACIPKYEGFVTQNIIALGDKFDTNKNNCVVFEIFLFNIGRGEAYNLRIEEICFLYKSKRYSANNKWNSPNYTLFANNRLEALYEVKISQELTNELLNLNQSISIHINIAYEDLTNKTYYLNAILVLTGLINVEKPDTKTVTFYLDPKKIILENKIK